MPEVVSVDWRVELEPDVRPPCRGIPVTVDKQSVKAVVPTLKNFDRMNRVCGRLHTHGDAERTVVEVVLIGIVDDQGSHRRRYYHIGETAARRMGAGKRTDPSTCYGTLKVQTDAPSGRKGFDDHISKPPHSHLNELHASICSFPQQGAIHRHVLDSTVLRHVRAWTRGVRHCRSEPKSSHAAHGRIKGDAAHPLASEHDRPVGQGRHNN